MSKAEAKARCFVQGSALGVRWANAPSKAKKTLVKGEENSCVPRIYSLYYISFSSKQNRFGVGR